MLSLKNIKLAINELIINKFPGIDIQSNDVKEGFKRPSFFVDFDNVYKIDHLSNFERGMTVRIYYFPSDRHKYQLEVLEKQEEIEGLFRLGFTIGDRHLSIANSIESDVIDGVLEVSFELRYFDSHEDNGPEGPKMEELSLNA